MGTKVQEQNKQLTDQPRFGRPSKKNTTEENQQEHVARNSRTRALSHVTVFNFFFFFLRGGIKKMKCIEAIKESTSAENTVRDETEIFS